MFDRDISTSGADLARVAAGSGVAADCMTDIYGNHLIRHDIKDSDQCWASRRQTATFAVTTIALIPSMVRTVYEYPLPRGKVMLY